MAEIIVIVLLLVIGGLMGSAITLILVARPQAQLLRDGAIIFGLLERENDMLRQQLAGKSSLMGMRDDH